MARSRHAAPGAGHDSLLEAAGRDLAGWTDPAQRLHDALARDELRLYAQAIASLRGGEPFLMAEALVRLAEEESAHLPPGDFLPVFEEYGMMPQLDRWVVDRVLRVLAAGESAGFRRFSVNVASSTLSDRGMPRFVAAQLERSGLPPASLCFEIDESDVLRQLEVAAAFARAVRGLGCKVAIDGFGRRAVSFAPLKSMQIDYLKVDGSITRKLLNGDAATRKLQAIVRVATALGFGVIAEFVEDAEVLERLRALGVGYAQGFGVSRPGPLGRTPAARD